MGAGRKTRTVWLTEKSVPHGTTSYNSTARNLRKNDLSGVIFGCKHGTIKECYFKQLFGLPAPHISYVRKISPGLPLFLFNYSDRKLHGVFEATSAGQLNINPYGWTANETDNTLYPAQVRVRVRMQCKPLVEDQFGPIISENYYESKLFWFELDRVQTEKLISLFSSFRTTVSTAIPTNREKWSSKFNVSNSLPNTRQGGKVSIKSKSINGANPDQSKSERESSKDIPRSSGESRMLETAPDHREAENEHMDGGGLKQDFGRSYSAVLRNKVTSAANSSQSNMGFCDGSILGGERSLLEVADKKDLTEQCHEKPNIGWAFPSVLRNTSAAIHSDNSDVETGSLVHQGSGRERCCLEAIDHTKSAQTFETDVADEAQSCEHSYYSDVQTVGTSHPQKKWSNLLNDSANNDAGNEIEEIKLPVPGLTNLSSSDESNFECKLPRLWIRLDEEENCIETVFDEPEDHEEYMDLRLINDVLNTPVKKEGNTYFTQCAPNDTTPTCHLRNEGLAPHLDHRSQPLEASVDQDAKQMIGEAHIDFQSNAECTSFSATIKNIVSDNNHSEDTGVTGMTPNGVYPPETANILEMKFSDGHSIVKMLQDEVKELRSSQQKQDQKICLLEHDLVKSRLELQLLKDRFKALECGLFEKNGNVEQEESESTNNPHLNLEESILLVGGFDGSSWLSAVDCYHPSLDHMESRGSMHFVRSYASAANLNGEVYVFGGVYDNVWYDEVESYNPVTNQWTSRPSLNQKKGNLAGVSFNENIYAIGGGNGAESFSTVEIFNLDSGRWILTQSMLHKRFAPAAAQINGAIYAVGGYDGKNYLKSVERFDPRDCSWTRLESMSTKRGCHSLAVLNEKLFAVGGYDGRKIVPTVEVFDPRKGSWMMGDSMIDSRGYSAAVVIGDAIYVIGGLKDNNEISDTVECYKEGLGWQSTNLKGTGKRCFFSAIVM